MKKKLVAIAAAAPPALGGMGYTATQLGNKQSPAEKNAEALAWTAFGYWMNKYVYPSGCEFYKCNPKPEKACNVSNQTLPCR